MHPLYVLIHDLAHSLFHIELALLRHLLYEYSKLYYIFHNGYFETYIMEIQI